MLSLVLLLTPFSLVERLMLQLYCDTTQDIAIQPVLISLRNAIHDAIPEAKETIAWSMPTWKKKGNIIHFSVSKNHIGVHIGEEAVTHFHERLKGLEVYKSVIRLKFDQEMPLVLFADIAKWSFAKESL